MSKFKLKFLLFFPLLFSHCSSRKSTNDTLFIPDYEWRIKIPDFLINQNKDEWKRVQGAGKNAIEETYNIKIKNKLKTVFVFKSNDNSVFEAVSEPISKEQITNYSQVCENMNNVFYNTIRTQVPTAQIDTAKGIELVGNLQFQVLKMKLTFPNGSSSTTISYRRVFGNLELTVSAMYSSEASGNKILSAFRSSTFAEAN